MERPYYVDRQGSIHIKPPDAQYAIVWVGPIDYVLASLSEETPTAIVRVDDPDRLLEDLDAREVGRAIRAIAPETVGELATAEEI